MPLRGSGDVVVANSRALIFSSHGGVLYSRIEPQRHALPRLDERSVEAHLGTQGKAHTGLHVRYGVTKLVYYEHYDRLMDARAREYKVKHGRRAWKLKLIEEMNPTWRDLYDELNS
jgi:predicted GIY-YIG superfamily endonuclease